MDEALTEDEFYSGPLLGIFNRLASPRNNNILATVTTLILDGLTVPADLVREIIAEDRFHVRILSIRDAKHLNERKLRQVLKYAVRPTRPEGTPRLKGLYIFGDRDPENLPAALGQAVYLKREQYGSAPTIGDRLVTNWPAAKVSKAPYSAAWYAGAGRVVEKTRRKPDEWAEWAEVLVACKGIVAFDAVLCRGPRHDVSTAAMDAGSFTPAGSGRPVLTGYLPPALATVSLRGCRACDSCPEGAAELGNSPSSDIPLLAPVPLHASTVRAAQDSTFIPSAAFPSTQLVLRCDECLKSRWCERCNRWWDEGCYSATADQDMSMGSRRECFGCGFTVSVSPAYFFDCLPALADQCISVANALQNIAATAASVIRDIA
jgi:hypothetical protein